MASCSTKSVKLMGKRKPQDGLETKPFLSKHKEKKTKSHDDANLILLKETVDEETPYFAEETVDEETPESPEDALRKKTLFVSNLSSETQIPDIINFFKDVAQVANVRLIINHQGKHVGQGYVEFASANEAEKALEEKNGQYLHTCQIILDETSYFVEELAAPKKTLFVAHLSRQTPEISDLVDFFQDVGQVVRVRLILDSRGQLLGCGYVEFASAYEASEVLQKKNGDYFHGQKIVLNVAYGGATYLPPPKYCLDHKVWYKEDYLRIQESLQKQENAAGLGETSDFAEVVLLIANLSSQTTKIKHIIHFFKDVGEIVSVRLITNHEGKHVGYGFVQFASSDQAKKALEEKNGEYLHDHRIFLMKRPNKSPISSETVGSVRQKTLFVDELPYWTKISDVIDFFKDVAEVDYVRLIVDKSSKLMGCGYVGFTSGDEAEKALEKKKGEYLHDSKIVLVRAEYLQGMYCIDHKVWYEDYVQQESLVTEETPDFAEEVAARKKTVFAVSRNFNLKIKNVRGNFKMCQVVRVRHVVDRWGKPLGCCFIEYATANEAKRVAYYKSGRRFFVNVAEMDHPYPFRPRYNLAEKLWCEDEVLHLLGKPKVNRMTFTGKNKRIIFEE